MKKTVIDKLLCNVALGDERSFEQLYEGTKNGVFAFLYTYLHNRADTEDALQTVFLKVKLHVSGYRQGTNGNAWLLQIAKNTALNMLAKRKNDASLDDVVVPHNDQYKDGSITKLMQQVLDEEEQRVVTLHVLWSYKHREIAELIGCPTSTITSKYKRAIAKLKKSLKETTL